MSRASADRIVLDIGNSAVTVAPCSGVEVLHSLTIVHAGVDGSAFDLRLREAIDSAPAGIPIGIAQVNPAATARVLAVAAMGRRVLVAPRDFAPTIENACESPHTVGLDRLFNAEAVDRDGDFVIVDAGTAITVDRVSRGVFQGGAIAPGIRLCYRALHRDTGGLPEVEPGSDAPPALGRHTIEAIRVGVERGLAGLVDRLATDLLAELSEVRRATARVVVTGGDASILGRLLLTPHRIDPTLTLRGIAKALYAVIG